MRIEPFKILKLTFLRVEDVLIVRETLKKMLKNCECVFEKVLNYEFYVILYEKYNFLKFFFSNSK